MKTRNKLLNILRTLPMALIMLMMLTPASAYAEDITVQFTDPNFLAALRIALNKNVNDNIYDTDVANIKSLNVSGKGIANFAGIEYFTALENLNCSNNNLLVSLPPLPPTLTTFNCSHNFLVSLPALPSGLINLDCSYNRLYSLPALPATLTTLDCTSNQLASLPELPSALQQLYCQVNQLSSLPELPLALTALYCSYNQLSSLPELPLALTALSCHANQLTSIALNSNVTYLYISVMFNNIASRDNITGFSGEWDEFPGTDVKFRFDPQNPPDFKGAINMVDLPYMAAVGVPLTLSGKVVPTNATNKNVEWYIRDAGTTGATISNGNILIANATGTVQVFARFAQSLTPYTDNFGVLINIIVLDELPAYVVNCVPSSDGKVKVDRDDAKYTVNETVTLTVTPDAGFVLDAIYAQESTPVTLTKVNDNTYTFTMPDYDVTVTATFRNRDAADEAKELIEAVTNWTVAQATANTKDEVKQWLADTINILPGMSATGITVTAEDITLNSFKAAEEGKIGLHEGTNGSFNFTVSLVKDNNRQTTAPRDGVITATPFDWKQEMISRIEKSKTYIVLQAEANTKEEVTEWLVSKINTLIYDLGVIITREDINITDFKAAYKGVDGSFNFTIELYNATVNDGVITATSYDWMQDIEKAQSLIENESYVVAQAEANDEETVTAWLVSRINALPGMSDTDITVSATDITLSNFNAATGGTSANLSGTNGSFNFTVLLSKETVSRTTAPKDGVITATPHDPTPDIENAKSLIENVANWTVAQATANTETEVKAWLASQINALPGMIAMSISVSATDITLSNFNAAKEGTPADLTGVNGSFNFTVSLKKGSVSQSTAIQNGIITATPHDPEQDIADAKSLIEGNSYFVTQVEANDEQAVREWLTPRINTLISATGITINESNITIADNFIPAISGGADGSFTFTVSLSKEGATSAIAGNNGTIIATPPVDAETPTISQLQSATYDVGVTAAALSITAHVSDGGTLSYQWFSNTTNSNTGGAAVSGATGTSYTPPTGEAEIAYYYVVVTNTNTLPVITGSQTATATSNVATITVNALVNAQTPVITQQPESATYNVGGAATAMSVTANVNDGGILTYQWFSNTTNSNTGGRAITGATNDNYTPPTATEGITYYYVVITNTNTDPKITGLQTATATSNVATITVNALVNAQTPVITAHPQPATYIIDAPATALSVTASVSDGGTLSYQWYSNTSNSNTGGAAISGATSASYTPPTTAEGITYYYVVVTNTNTDPKITGLQTATATSNAAAITVNPLVNAQTPVITSHPQSATYTMRTPANPLSVTAKVTDGGKLTYQWYSNTSNSNTGGTAIAGATGTRYTPPTTSAGITYYYVVVTNTNTNVNGATVATATSNVATITVNTLTNAQTPVITAHPQSATYYNVGIPATPLFVTANVTDGGTLSYQWYSNAANSNVGGTSISGATSASYTPSTETEGVTYYYVVVTNTNTGPDINGLTVATATSNAASITVNTLVNAETPVITAQPQPVITVVKANASISVTASVSDGGTLSYQWYINTVNSNADGAAIDGATSASYTLPTGETGTTYYYVVVTNTNTNPNVTGSTTATVTSLAASVTVNEAVNAQTPAITAHPQPATYYSLGTSAIPLFVTASVTDGGILSYQWYSNTTDSNAGGTVIDGATDASYTPSTDAEGVIYYYVAVTNTNTLPGITGLQTATATSVAAAITVNVFVNAQAPNITAQPQTATYIAGTPATALSITANVTDGGTLSYQWFGNTGNSNSGGAAIAGATNASYTPPTNTAGITYYYVVVTNTNTLPVITGSTIATVTSNAAAITVNPLVNAQTPEIIAHPQPEITVVGTEPSLSVLANITDGGKLSYQWFSNTTGINAGGTAIAGATRASYKPSTAATGTTYYYVVVTNTNTDPGINGSTVATATSEVAMVTVNKAPQDAPAAPTPASKTATSITLNAIAGNVQYSIDGVNWQDSPEFTGLVPNTSYTFHAMYKESDTHLASPASEASEPVTTDKATLGGTVTVSGSAVFGETLTAITTSLTSTPSVVLETPAYQWKRNGNDISGATGSTYALVEADIATAISVTVTVSNTLGSVTSATSAVLKASQNPPATPTLADKTTTGVTLNAISGNVQYSIDGVNWQNSPVFSGLVPHTAYNFTARYAADNTHEASPSSAALTVTTYGGSEAALISLAVNRTSVSVANGESEYVAGCGENSVILDMTVSPYARVTVDGAAYTGQSIPLTGDVTKIAIVVTSDDGTKVYNHTLTVFGALNASKIIIHRFTDVLAINSNPTNNGGYDIEGVRWYRNGNSTLISTEWFIEIKSAASDYYAEVNIGGSWHRVCGSAGQRPSSVVAYPNPVTTGESLILEVPFDFVDGYVNIISVNGSVVKRNLPLPNEYNSINVSELSPGIYLLNVISKTGNSETVKIIKN